MTKPKERLRFKRQKATPRFARCPERMSMWQVLLSTKTGSTMLQSSEFSAKTFPSSAAAFQLFSIASIFCSLLLVDVAGRICWPDG